MTCLPFEAVILLYGSSNLYAKQKQPFYIYEYASPNPGIWTAKNPDKIGVFAEHIFFMFLLWWEKMDSNHRSKTQQIYSLPPLATREFSHVSSFQKSKPTA